MSGILQVENLSCGYDGKPVVKGVSFEVKLGDFVGIVGPNGCGKTTLLRALSGIIAPHAGEVKIRKVPLHKLNRREIARKVAFIPQMMEPIPGFTVEDLVLMGRTPYLDRFAFESDDDYDISKWALEELKIEKMAHLPVTSLSGGEFQRVAIARALAQEPQILLLDEPTAHLDLRYQMRILRLLSRIRSTRSIIATFHDLSLAARFCRKMILIKNGEMVAAGKPNEVLTQDNIWNVFRIKAQVKANPRNKRYRYVVV
jgi:iron complex transport system ATP-binding protein